MREEKDEIVNKASPAIHIQNTITLLQRKAWTVLLFYAYDKLRTEDTYSVTVQELMDILEFDSHNREYLKEAMEVLVGCKVKWNLLNKDKTKTWGVTTLLAHAEIKQGVCTYSYSPPLREKLHNPKMYAKINLRLQNKINSKHALALWELCVDYLHESEGYGETPYIPLQTFREMMGIGDDEYQDFKRLNRDVIKKPIAVINDVTDFHVEVEYKRQKRKVVAIKLKVRQVKQIPDWKTKQRELFPDIEDLEGIALELCQMGVARHEALKIYNQGFDYVDAGKRPESVEFETYIREKIHLAQNARDVQNKGGFVICAIKENWHNPHFAEQEREKARKELERQKAQIKKQWEAETHEILAHLIEQKQGAVDVAMRKLAEQDTLIQERYDASKPFADQSVVVQARVRQSLKETFGDQFAVTDTAYEGKIADIDQQMATLAG